MAHCGDARFPHPKSVLSAHRNMPVCISSSLLPSLSLFCLMLPPPFFLSLLSCSPVWEQSGHPLSLPFSPLCYCPNIWLILDLSNPLLVSVLMNSVLCVTFLPLIKPNCLLLNCISSMWDWTIILSCCLSGGFTGYVHPTITYFRCLYGVRYQISHESDRAALTWHQRGRRVDVSQKRKLQFFSSSFLKSPPLVFIFHF